MSGKSEEPEATTERPDADAQDAPDPSPRSGEADDAGAEDGGSAPWEPSPPRIVRCADLEALAEAAASRFLDVAERAVARDGNFLVVLAGGSTPLPTYRRLTEPPYRDAVPWDRTYFVFGDERCVPPDHEDSNYRRIREALFEPLGIRDLQVLRMKGEHKPDEAARWYEIRLDDLFLLRPKRRFDLAMLGVGTDGHTASLFPGTPALDETERWAVANPVPQLDTTRITLTFKALHAVGRILFLVAGEDKATVIAEAFGGKEHPEPHPCERIAPRHVIREVLVDPGAASAL